MFYKTFRFPASLSASAIQAGKRIHGHISGSQIWPNDLKRGFLDETPGKGQSLPKLGVGKTGHPLTK